MVGTDRSLCARGIILRHPDAEVRGSAHIGKVKAAAKAVRPPKQVKRQAGKVASRAGKAIEKKGKSR